MTFLLQTDNPENSVKERFYFGNGRAVFNPCIKGAGCSLDEIFIFGRGQPLEFLKVLQLVRNSYPSEGILLLKIT